MLRCSFVFAGLMSVAIASAVGCRACSSCHDYDSPVANCQCGACGAQCGCGTCNGGCNSGCNGASNGGCNCGGERSAPAYVQSPRSTQANAASANGTERNTQPSAQQTQPANGADQQ